MSSGGASSSSAAVGQPDGFDARKSGRRRNRSATMAASLAQAAAEAEQRANSRFAGRKRRTQSTDDATGVDSSANPVPASAADGAPIPPPLSPPKDDTEQQPDTASASLSVAPSSSMTIVRRATGEPAGDYLKAGFIRAAFSIRTKETPPVHYRTSRTKINEFQLLSQQDRKAKIAEWESMTKEEQAAWRRKLPDTHKATRYGKKKSKATSRSTTGSRKRKQPSKSKRHTRSNPQGQLVATQMHDSPAKRQKVADTARTKDKKKKRQVNTAPTKAQSTHDATVIKSEDILLSRIVIQNNMTNSATDPFVVSATVPAPTTESSSTNSNSNSQDREKVTISVPVGAKFVFLAEYKARESRPSGKDHPEGVLHDPNDPSRSKFILASTCNPVDTKAMLSSASLVLKNKAPKDDAPGARNDYHIIGEGDWGSARNGGLSKRDIGTIDVYDGKFASAVESYKQERKSRRKGVRKSGPLSSKETDEHIDKDVGVFSDSPVRPIRSAATYEGEDDNEDEPGIESELSEVEA